MRQVAASVDTVPSLPALGEYCEAMRLLRPDSAAVQVARLRLLDTYLCLLHGLSSADGHSLRDLLCGDQQMLLAERVALLCGATRSTELDDIHIGSCTTVGSVVVPTALALVFGDDGYEVDDLSVLRAIAAGYEAMVRFGAAADGAHIIYQGIWSTYLAAPLASAAVTATLLGLSGDALAHALAIAAARAVGTSTDAGGGKSSRWYTLGRAAAEGVQAALAAADGFEGDLRLFERNFSRATGITLSTARLVEETAQSAIHDIDVKPFRTQRQSLSAVEAFCELVPNDSALSECSLVEVAVPEQYRQNVDRNTLPYDRLTPGIQYLLAIAAYRRESLWSVHRRPVHDTPAIREFMSRVTVTADPELTAQYPDHWCGRVRTTWCTGDSQELLVRDPAGSARRPYDWSAVVAKHRRVSSASHPDTLLPDAVDAVASGLQEFGAAGTRSYSALETRVMDAIAAGRPR